MPYTRLVDMYSGLAASIITSNTFWVGDANTLSLQLLGSPSTTSMQGSNADGRSEAISSASWSHITVVGAGIYSITPGFRWTRLIRSETTNAFLELQQQWAR